MRWMSTRLPRAAAVGLVLMSGVRCAQERPPINQVQADALAKSFFVGPDLTNLADDPEFYMRGTVVDVGYGAAQQGLFTSTYAQPVARIRWEITEDNLNARLSYEIVASSDGKGNPVDGLLRKTTNDGQLVASYKIKSHFDIRRAYNPTTGEEQNIFVENSTDRPWYMREYFRIDWSQNLATDAYNYDTLASLGISGAIQYAPLAYTVLDPNDPDAPHFEAAQGYFDVTNKAFATPVLVDVSSLGMGVDKVPSCKLSANTTGGTAPVGNCNPVEITLRQSFRKVIDTDYEPKNYDGYRFQAFGPFETKRTGYSRGYGLNDGLWYRFASRYNLWNRSHYYSDPVRMTGEIPCATKETTETPTGNPNADPNRDPQHTGTAEECQGVTAALTSETAPSGIPGSQCDVFKRRCTLPYAARQPVTITWYVNGGSTAVIDSLNSQVADTSDPAARKTLSDQLSAAVAREEDIFEATNWATEEWDLALKTAIATTRQVECRRTGGGDTCNTTYPMWTGQQEDNQEAVAIAREVDACRRKAATGAQEVTTSSSALAPAPRDNRGAGWASRACQTLAREAAQKLALERGNPSDASAYAIGEVAAMDPVLVLCHNPVIASDHPACGPVGLSPRLGDLRYNTVLTVPTPQDPSPWGIMADAEDPLTGEKVAASINIWSHATDINAQNLVDIVRYVNGELKTSDITEGTYVTNWAQASQLTAGGRGPMMTRQQVTERLAATTDLDPTAFEQAQNASVSPGAAAAVTQFNDDRVSDLVASSDVASKATYDAQARMNLMRGSPTESELINPAMIALAGINGALPPGAALDEISPVALNNPTLASSLERRQQNALAERGACVLTEAPEFTGVTGIAAAMKRKFPQADHETTAQTASRSASMLSYIRRRYQYGIIAHEMGHSIGLRHNFVSSAAPLHYAPQYWQLRTKNGTVESACTEAVDTSQDANAGARCVGPRYFDPLTDEEQAQMIWMFMQSSVMDYPGDVSQNMMGLGAFDFAATRMFYGDVTSVYDVRHLNGNLDGRYLTTGAIGKGMLATTDTFGGISGIQYRLGTSSSTQFHYSQLQTNFHLISDCQTVTPAQPSSWREDVDGKWDVLLDGKIVSINGALTKCRSLPVDYMGWDQLRLPTTSEAGASYRGGNAVDPATLRVRVPYSFASDNWADLANTSVLRHDSGADPYEQAMFFVTAQEDRHIFDNYRRGRTSFSVRGASDRSFSRYSQKLQNLAGGIAFLSSVYKDFATSQGFTWDTLWPFVASSHYKENTIAATVAMDHFTRQLSRPEPGRHYFMKPEFDPDQVLRSANDPNGVPGTTSLVMPNGATGYLMDVGFGGHLLENSQSSTNGDYNTEYTLNAGSYYDKINTAILLSQSEDRFVSESRQDFYDARYRSVGMADVLPNGYRRILANALTGDRSLLAPHVTASGGVPEVASAVDPGDPTNQDTLLYPKNAVGWTSFWPKDGPRMCFSSNGSNVCSSFTGSAAEFKPLSPGAVVGVDPQIGWEVQKFLIAWTLAYIPANQQSNWLDMLRIYRLGPDSVPQIDARIEWEDPVSGQIYYASTYGMECLFGPTTATTKTTCEAPSQKGRWVQKGIAARVLEYANELTSRGYVADVASYPTRYNEKGRFMVKRQPDGTAIVAGDPAMRSVTSDGSDGPVTATCDLNVAPAAGVPPCTPLTKWDNHWAVELDAYKKVPDYLWEVVVRYKLGTPAQLGFSP